MSTMLAGIALGGVTGFGMILAEAAITGASTMINLREAVAVGLTICGMVWWLGRKFQSIESELNQLKQDVGAIKKRLDCDEDE